MIYTFKCGECEHHEEVWNVKMDERGDLKTCPKCEKESFRYDFGLTMRGCRVFYQEDVNSYMERRFGRSKTWQPPPSQNKGSAGKTSGRAGAGRHYPGDPRFSKKEI
jgi:putative FmdB family regulatory protein